MEENNLKISLSLYIRLEFFFGVLFFRTLLTIKYQLEGVFISHNTGCDINSYSNDNI